MLICLHVSLNALQHLHRTLVFRSLLWGFISRPFPVQCNASLFFCLFIKVLEWNNSLFNLCRGMPQIDFHYILFTKLLAFRVDYIGPAHLCEVAGALTTSGQHFKGMASFIWCFPEFANKILRSDFISQHKYPKHAHTFPNP